jgi:hypothetical protein
LLRYYWCDSRQIQFFDQARDEDSNTEYLWDVMGMERGLWFMGNEYVESKPRTDRWNTITSKLKRTGLTLGTSATVLSQTRQPGPTRCPISRKFQKKHQSKWFSHVIKPELAYRLPSRRRRLLNITSVFNLGISTGAVTV